MPAEYPTLMDVARRSGDKSVSEIVEILNKTNPIIDDIPWIECNSGVTHITTIRTGIPKPAWRMLNSGVPLAKSTTKQVKAGCGMLEVYSEVDEDQVNLARRNGGQQGAADYLASENAAFIEGFGREIARMFFYGDPSDPKEPVGLINYYNSLDGEVAAHGNVIDAGGTGADNTSIWLVQWGDRAVHGIYPQGSKAGLIEDYLGVHTVKDAEGKQFQAHRTHYKWDNGLVVRDWRCAVRIANVSMAKLKGAASEAPKICELLTRATYALPQSSGSTRSAIYCRKEVLTALDLQVQSKSNLMLNYETVFGRKCITFRGIPLREQETLLDTEAAVVGA